MGKELERLQKGERAASITTIATVFLSIGKGIIGVLSGSLVLITDALHSAADILPIFASWFGLKISRRDPDEKFPYGYYKAESVVTLFISFFILYVAVEFSLEGYSKIFTFSEISYPIVAGGAAFISMIVSGFIARYQKNIGEETSSESLIANSKESKMDILSSGVVLLAIILSHFKIPYVEGLVTIGIAFLIFKVGLETIRDSVYALMDVSPSKEIEKKVIEIIGSISGVEGFGDLKLRKAGPFIFGECIVMIRKFVDVDKAHQIADNIENKVKNKIERVDSFTIHIEPYETEKVRIVVPVKENKGNNSQISDHFGRSEFFAFASLDINKEEIENLEIIENEFRDREIRAGLSASNFIGKEKVDALITKEIGEISFHTLRDQLIDIYLTEKNTVKQTIDDYMKGKTERLSEPTRHKE